MICEFIASTGNQPAIVGDQLKPPLKGKEELTALYFNAPPKVRCLHKISQSTTYFITLKGCLL